MTERTTLKNLIDREKLLAYTQARIDYLNASIQSVLEDTPLKKREFKKREIKGRIRELKKLRVYADEGNTAIDDAGQRFFEKKFDYGWEDK